ncbi:MAG: hypothetical protein GX556_17350 [Fibrobacter sp.]|nr:hypothetical protein [Fibrobacter sp.]
MLVEKRYTNSISKIITCMVLVLVPSIVLAQSSGLTTFTGSLNASVSTIFGYVRVTLTVGLLLYTIWPFYHALIGEGDKSRYWWQIIGIAVFLIILNVFPTVFNAIFGQNVNVTT